MSNNPCRLSARPQAARPLVAVQTDLQVRSEPKRAISGVRARLACRTILAVCRRDNTRRGRLLRCRLTFRSGRNQNARSAESEHVLHVEQSLPFVRETTGGAAACCGAD